MWFKSDIGIYDREDFLLAWEECRCLANVWEWVQRESIKQESETIFIKNSLYLRAILRRLQVSEAEFRDAQKLLGELELIIFDNPNEIILPNWLLNQGLYFAKKQAETLRKAEYREKKKQNSVQDVPRTTQGQDEDITGKSDIRVEEIREDKIREENIREENTREKKINKKEKEIFLPPTQPEVIEYLLSKSEEYSNLANYSICEQIAKKYITHFEAESWVKVNNKPIRSWKLDLNKRLEGDWLAPHLFKPKTESKAVAQWAQMVNNAQDRVVRDIMNEMRQKGKV